MNINVSRYSYFDIIHIANILRSFAVYTQVKTYISPNERKEDRFSCNLTFVWSSNIAMSFPSYDDVAAGGGAANAADGMQSVLFTL